LNIRLLSDTPRATRLNKTAPFPHAPGEPPDPSGDAAGS